MSLAVYMHDLNPFAIGPFGASSLGIRWYGLSYIAGFAVAWAIIRLMARRGLSPLKPERAGDFVLTVAIGTVIGGRLGYCLFYRPDLLIDFSSSPPFWGVFAINEGGMASHGGILGILTACLIFAHRDKLPRLHLMDLCALASTIGIFFGRCANFVNGELFGRPCDASLPWAVKFPQEIVLWTDPSHPKHEVWTGPIMQQIKLLAEAADPRSIIDAARQNPQVAELLRPLLTPRHPSQIYEALMEGALMFVILAIVWAKPRKPGIVAGWFLVAYAVVRIIGEQFRMPDAGIGFQALGLTRGQWLSVVMLGAGIICMVVWARRDVAKIGGWASADRKADDA
ncbi:prolipoprotein diacylglyceryl transferase [Planctomycetales bacterium ZRK34]|nr:prolipoprotein diacylglyceryl transferase [Planctomycetales bacterium ZRK34]